MFGPSLAKSRGIFPRVISSRGEDVNLVKVQEEGVEVGTKFTLNFIGDTITAELDEPNNRINVTSTATLNHGSLAGLSNDDHTQYILINGTRAFTGNQSLGGFNITNVNDISLNQGTIQQTPTTETEIANKAYVDSLIRGKVELFFTNNASDIMGYKDMEVDAVTDAEETITQAITANDVTLIASFASILNEEQIDAITSLETGIYSTHIHASSNFALNMTIYYEFHKRTSGGAETLLGTSHDSGVLTTSDAEYELHASITSDLMLSAGDRIVVKVYGRNGNAAVKNISIIMEDQTLSRVEFPAFIPPSFVPAHVASHETGGTDAISHDSIDDVSADDHHAQSHNIASHSDTTATGTELNTLTDGSDTTLHKHVMPMIIWRLTNDQSGAQNPLGPSSDWEVADDTKNEAELGSSSVTESSGIFSFASPGYWSVKVYAMANTNADEAFSTVQIHSTQDNSAYSQVARGLMSVRTSASLRGQSTSTETLLRVANLSNDKIKIVTTVVTGFTFMGSDSANYTYIVFEKKADL